MKRGGNKVEGDTGESPHTTWAEPRTGELQVGGHNLFGPQLQHLRQSCRMATLAGATAVIRSATAGAQPTTRLGSGSARQQPMP